MLCVFFRNQSSYVSDSQCSGLESSNESLCYILAHYFPGLALWEAKVSAFWSAAVPVQSNMPFGFADVSGRAGNVQCLP